MPAPRIVTMSDTGIPFAGDEDLAAADAFRDISERIIKLCEEM